MYNLKKFIISKTRKIITLLDLLCMVLSFSVYMMADPQLKFPFNFLLVFALVAVTVFIMIFIGAYDSLDVGLITITKCILPLMLCASIEVMAVSVITDFRINLWSSFIVPVLFSIILMYFVRAMYNYYLHEYRRTLEKSMKSPTMIVGAGAAASILLKELLNGNSAYYPVCIVDDDVHKIGTRLYDIPVLGAVDDIPHLAAAHEINTIIIAIPSASPAQVSRIAEICSKTKCFVKILPSISAIIDNNGNFTKSITDINMEDLLGRAPIQVDTSLVRNMVRDKVCLVTGGGGSIGSELCRQIMKYSPMRLIIVDIYENNAYDIQQELRLKYGMDLPLSVEIASVRDYSKMDVIFKRYKPDLVFHAAAHKHVPLMEYSAEEAVKNNVAGTYNIASLAVKYKADRFLLISTDKAVNPTNVMGASKRCCEKVIKYFSERSKNTVFVTVRFGNVLGSNGSVVPLFEKQIKNGGPITITHPDITRYFMTIPEAVSLVLQAETMADSGQIFVLNMGKPVKLVTLAENLIKMRGLEPYKDIKIEFIGLREGEKLYEELRLDEEKIEPTYNEKIFIGSHISLPDDFKNQLSKLLTYADNNDSGRVIEQLQVLCPTFEPDKRIHNAPVMALEHSIQ